MRQAIEIQFGGKTRHLVYDYNAIAELQDVAGTYHSNMAHMKAVRAMLWAGLLAETLDSRGRETENTLSLIEVGEILAKCSKAERNKLMESIQEARGIAEPPDEERPTPANPNS